MNYSDQINEFIQIYPCRKDNVASILELIDGYDNLSVHWGLVDYNMSRTLTFIFDLETIGRYLELTLYSNGLLSYEIIQESSKDTKDIPFNLESGYEFENLTFEDIQDAITRHSPGGTCSTPEVLPMRLRNGMLGL